MLSSIAMEAKAYWSYSTPQLAAWKDGLTISAGTIASRPTYVAEIAAQIVGFFVLVPASDRWVLDHLWVHPGSMRKGVGRALLARARSVAAAGGAVDIAIDADPYATRFYLACGAVRAGTVAAPIDGAPERVRPQLLLDAAKT